MADFYAARAGTNAGAPLDGFLTAAHTGGATAFADPDLHLGFGYSMNAMDPAQSGRQRPQALVAALNSCLGR